MYFNTYTQGVPQTKIAVYRLEDVWIISHIMHTYKGVAVRGGMILDTHILDHRQLHYDLMVSCIMRRPHHLF